MKVGKDGNLRALVADSGNCVWAAWQSGAMERFTFNGKLLVKKVQFLSVILLLMLYSFFSPSVLFAE